MKDKSRKWLITYNRLNVSNLDILNDLDKFCENLDSATFQGRHLFVVLKTTWHMSDMEKIFPDAFMIVPCFGESLNFANYVYKSGRDNLNRCV